MNRIQEAQLQQPDESFLCRENPYLPDGEGCHGITLADREWMNPLITAENGLATDNCFGTYYLWGDAFGLRLSSFQGRLIAYCGIGEELRFFYPHGRGPLKPVICEMNRIAKEQGAMLVINGVTHAQKEELEQVMPGYFTFRENRERADYIYCAESLASLAGKKLHSKKNHCNRFERDYPDWHSEILGKEHVSECLALLSDWEQGHQEAADEMQDAEQTAVKNAFLHYQDLKMEGIVLYAGEQLAGFSFGEMLGENGFDVHFEKAYAHINGAYAMVNREMARMLLKCHPGLTYINREEDMGHENLRKAKESYRPAFLIEKYTACHR